MSWVDWLTNERNQGVRARLLRGDVPGWIQRKDQQRSKYIIRLFMSKPPWVKLDDLLALNEARRERSKKTGVAHSLDHIVPLNHPQVCGLTVPWNIAIVAREDDLAKGNNWSPE